MLCIFYLSLSSIPIEALGKYNEYINCCFFVLTQQKLGNEIPILNKKRNMLTLNYSLIGIIFLTN
jgi:hypothetical protein